MPSYNSGKGTWELRRKSFVHVIPQAENFQRSGETVIGLDCDRDTLERHRIDDQGLDHLSKRMREQASIAPRVKNMDDEMMKSPPGGAMSDISASAASFTSTIPTSVPSLKNIAKFSNGFNLYRDQDRSVYVIYPYVVKAATPTISKQNSSKSSIYIQSEFIIETLGFHLVELNPSWAIKIFDYPEFDKKLEKAYREIEAKQKQSNSGKCSESRDYQKEYGRYCGAKICFEEIRKDKPAENHPVWLSLMWDEGQNLINKYKDKMRAVEVNFIDSRSS